jgi:hypothetical protein
MDFVTARFPIVIETHDREQFQKEGHFVPRMVDDHGMPREWQGAAVFIGTLNHELLNEFGQVNEGGRQQILRVYADTPEELDRLMSLRIVETFHAQFNALSVQAKEQVDIKRLNDEVTRMRLALADAAASKLVPGRSHRRAGKP